ncbi:holo-ACP synthase [Streptosporangium saharense]|uniref:holo-ACP synthase n=1 Tax=Streptosporangium saharense TaxID=1706840 RepID=UPI0033286A3D
MRIGIDIMHISRFTRISEHPRYRHVLFTEREAAAASTLRQPRLAEFLAGRFCAKEAVAKLLGRGFGQGLTWHDIEITADAFGAPEVTLHRGAATLASEPISLSLAHQGDLVVCVAMGKVR